jgi:predicted amidohydrolase YtcJ
VIPQETIYYNAVIHTMDELRPEADALLVRGERIAAVGDYDDLYAPGVDRVDVDGQAIVPGFNDSHCHILALGMMLDQLDASVDAVHAISEILDAIRERARSMPSDAWIVGRGYDQNMLTERRHPTRADLDTAGVNQPVMIYHTSGHVLTCNSRALQLAGLTPDTTDPPGGEVDRDERGVPSGVLKEAPAMSLVGRLIPPPTVEEGSSAIVRAMETMARCGITSASDAATGGTHAIESDLEMYRSALAAGVKGRIVLMPQIMHVAPPDGAEVHVPADFDVGGDTAWLAIGAAKIFSDGALSTRTAAVREPYEDDPSNVGILLWEQRTLEDMMARAHRAGWQIATHALGDRAVELVLDAYAHSIALAPRADHRHRIEHCMMLDAPLAERFKSLGVVASVQPDIYRLGDGYLAALGLDRASESIPLSLFRKAGVPVAFSSDAPVIPCDPLKAIRSAVERRTPGGIVLGQNHAVGIMDGIRYYTVGGAFATHTDRVKGRLRPGMLADFCVLSQDPARVSIETFGNVRVTMTVAGGMPTFAG